MTYKKFNEKYCDRTWEVQDDGGVTNKEFDQFSHDFKSVLKEICSPDWEIAKYSKGHYYVSAFLRNVANPEKFLYLNVGDIRHDPNWHGRILYRTAENEKDYRGGTNQYSSLENLQSVLERENRMIGEELAESRKDALDYASVSQSQIQKAESEREISVTETREPDKTDSLEAAKESIMTEKKVYEYGSKVKRYKDALRLAYSSGDFSVLENLQTELGLSDEECKGLEKPYSLAQKAQAEGKELHFNEICDCHHMELFDEADGSLKWESINHSGIEHLEVGNTYIEKCSSGGYGISNAFISIGESIKDLYVEYGEKHFPEKAVEDGKIILFDRSEPDVQSIIDNYIKIRFNIMSPLEIEAEYTESLGVEGEALSAYLKQVENKEFYDLNIDWKDDAYQINSLIHDFDDVGLYTFKPPFKLNQDIQLVAWNKRDRPIIQEIDTENGFINFLHDLHSRFDGNKDYESEVSALNNLMESFAKGKNKERYLKSVHTFEDDREKMEDFFRISKDEFLAAYDYLDETEYDATALKVNEKYRLKETVHADLRLEELFNGTITEEEKRDGSDTVVLSSGSTIERSGTEQEGFAFDMRNKNDSTYLAFDGMRAIKIAEINGISYFTNKDERMYWQGEVFSLNDDEIRLAFDSKGHGLLSKGMGKSEDKTVFLSIDAAKSLVFDDEVVYDKENGTLDFYAWATDALMEQFVPSEKRIGLEDSENEFYFDFIYKGEQDISLRLSYYGKDDRKVYETFRISPESESFDFLKKLMDDYAMRSDGKHIEDYKVLDGLEALKYAELSQIANASATPLFSDEMSRKVMGYYERQGISIYKNDKDELFAYHKNHDNSKREYEESPVEKWRLYEVIKNFIDGYDRSLAAGDMLNQFEEVRDSLAAVEINREKTILDSIKNDLVLTALNCSSEESYTEEDVKFLLTSENVEYALGSDILSNKAEIESFYNKYGIEGIRNAVLNNSLNPNDFSDGKILDREYAPVSLGTLMDFINIAELDSFDIDMAAECARTFVDNKVPLVRDKHGKIYQRNIGNSRTDSEEDLEMLSPSAVIDFYKNDLERQASFASEGWYAEHKHKTDTLNDIEDYLAKVENSVQLTTEKAHILSDYVNQNKEEFEKAFARTNGNIPAFEDMSEELAEHIIEALEIGDYCVRFDEKEKQFLIYDRQSADIGLFERAEAITVVSKAADIVETWNRDDATEHENEICERLEKFLYPTESHLPVRLTVNMNIPRSLQEKWQEAGNEKDICTEITDELLHSLHNSSEVKNVEYTGEAKALTIAIDTSFTVKEPFSYETMNQNEIENAFSMTFGSVLQERFKEYTVNDADGFPEKITFNSIKAEKPAVERTWEEISADWNKRDFDDARDRSKEILEENKSSFTDQELKEETVYQLLHDYIAMDSELSGEELSFKSSVLEEMSEKYVSNELRLEAAQNYFDEKREEWKRKNHTEKELRFEFADDANTEKIRICKEPLFQCDITKEIKDYLKIRLKVEKDIGFDFDDERNYAYYDFDSMHSPTYFVLCNDMAKEESNPYVAVRFHNKAYELLGRDLTFNAAQSSCASRIEIESNIENHDGKAKETIVHDVEAWKDSQDKQNLNKSIERKCYERYVEVWKLDHVLKESVSGPVSFNEFMDNEFRDAKTMKGCLSESLFKEYADGIKAFCKDKVERGNGITLDEANNLSDALSLLDKGSIKPSGEQILVGLEEGWKFDEACRGYIESGDQDLPGGVLVIIRIDDMQVFGDDHEAAIQAEKDGIRLIPKGEMRFELDEDGNTDERSYYDYIDTPENRKLLQEAGLLREKENGRQIGEEISLDLNALFNSEKYRPSGFDSENERITGGTSLWLENTSNRIEFSRDGSEAYYDLVDEVGTVLAMDGEAVIVAEYKDGMYRLIADEDSETPHMFYLSESDFEIAAGKVSLSQSIDGHDENNALLEEAKGLISDFCFNEYMSTPDFSDLRRVGIAYTDYFDPETQKEYPIQVSVNLIEPSITATFDGKELWKDDNYEHLQDFIATGLNSLDFDSLVSVSDYDINAILKGEPSSAKSDAMSVAVNGNCLGWEDEIEAWLNKNFYRETEYFNGSKTMGKYSHTLSPSVARPITESELKLFEDKTEPPEEILNRIKDSKFDEVYNTKLADIVSDLQEYMRSTYNARLSYSDILGYLVDDEKLQVLQPSNEEWLLLEPKETIEKLTKAGIRLDGIRQNENQRENKMEINEKTTENETMPVYTYSPFGYEGVLVQIETDLRKGIPAYDIVGISDDVVYKTRERIRAAFRNCDLEFPKERILQSASPADLKKEGHMDLAMAVSILSRTEDYIKEPVMVLGELEPSGKVRPARGNIAAVTTALNAGIRNIVCDPQTAKEVEVVKGIRILEVENLAEVNAGLRFLENFREIGTENSPDQSNEVEFSTEHDDEDLSIIMQGNYETVRAMEIAAAGKHNMLITGEPGCGKTMLNQYLLPKITPKLTGEESLSKQRIWSIAGLHSQRDDNRTAPFRMPHQTASIEGMCGGGIQARPGEISLAHNGTLFLDDAAEFRTSVLQMLRIPLETRSITLSRAGRSTVYPADFQLSLAMNPCPCGNYEVPEKICLDSGKTIKQYWNKVSGPVLDRIEIKNFMQKNENDMRKTTLKEMRGRIAAAIKIQRERGVYNSHLKPHQVAQYCKINDEDRKLLDQYANRFDISQRGIANTLKVALTIANMDGRVQIRTNDLREAMEMTAPVFDKPRKYQFDPAFPDGKNLTDELADSIREDIRNAIGDIDKNIKINGMRFYQPPENDGKLHLAVEYEADNWREDDIFNALAEEHFVLDGKEVDVNPITPAKSGTLDEYIKIVENADKIIMENDKKLNAREEMKKNSPGEGIEITPDDLKYAKKFLPKSQYSLVLQNTQGEEGEHFKQIIKRISEKARAIKGKTEIRDKDGKHPLAFKYTFPNDTKFYISEWNGDDEVFGYTVLKGDTQMSEWGYSSLSEIRDLSIKDRSGFPVTSEMTFYGLEPTIEKMVASDFPELAADMGEEKKSREEEMIQEFSRKLNEALSEKNLEPTTENIALASYHVMQTVNSAEKKELISLMEKCGCTDEAKSNEFLFAVKNYGTPDGKTKIKRTLEILSKKSESIPKVEDEPEAGM